PCSGPLRAFPPTPSIARSPVETQQGAEGSPFAFRWHDRRVHEWQAYDWADGATEATIALVADGPGPAEALRSRLGAVDARGDLGFDAALALRDDIDDRRRGVFQAERMTGSRGDWWVTVEPNGFHARSGAILRALADGGQAASFGWDVNAEMA